MAALAEFECLITWTPSVGKGRQLDAFQAETIYFWSSPFAVEYRGSLCV